MLKQAFPTLGCLCQEQKSGTLAEQVFDKQENGGSQRKITLDKSLRGYTRFLNFAMMSGKVLG